MGPDDLLCSQNAHDQNVHVRCAQWKINQPPSLKRERASLEGLSLVIRCGLVGDSRRERPSNVWAHPCPPRESRDHS